MEFKKFANLIKEQIEKMSEGELFCVDVSTEDVWNKYLDSFPENKNVIYKEKREYDCNCCRSFIKRMGNVVSIKDGKLISIWDVDKYAKNEFKIVAAELSNFVKSFRIKSIFMSSETNIGVASTTQQTENGTITWNHFNCKLDSSFVSDIPNALIGKVSDIKHVFERGLNELTQDSSLIVLDLIMQNSLYRGAEFKNIVTEWLKLQCAYSTKLDDTSKDIFIWSNVDNYAAGIRNTAIGTLLQDLSNDVDLDTAVTSFEKKVAPANYKRPTSLITKAMVTAAEKTINELDINDSLYRRYATVDDITINNVLFVNRDNSVTDVNPSQKISDILSKDITKKDSDKKFNKLEEIGIEEFIHNVLPKAKAVEVLVENKHMQNFVSLIAPKFPEAKNILKWNNNFTWTYKGDVTDSIKEKVKSAGGNIDGYLRVSLSWFNFDDLDVSIVEPDGNRIYFCNKQSIKTHGTLDVDMNAGSGKTRTPVENIIYPHNHNMINGVYKIEVNNYNKRENIDVGFILEIEYDNVIQQYTYTKPVKHKEIIHIGDIIYKNNILDFKSNNTCTDGNTISKECWGIKTNNFAKVDTIMLSPNYWDDNAIGNKHYFFMLNQCLNDDTARGLYNEYLSNELNDHRKVFEILASRLKCEKSNEQLSGIGFSSTQRNELICKVTSDFTRLLKIKF